jgi:hypothetical protein
MKVYVLHAWYNTNHFVAGVYHAKYLANKERVRIRKKEIENEGHDERLHMDIDCWTLDETCPFFAEW